MALARDASTLATDSKNRGERRNPLIEPALPAVERALARVGGHPIAGSHFIVIPTC